MARADIKETTPQMIARVIQHGGKILVVGGGADKLPDRYHTHQQILLWDDNSQGIAQKEIPANVKVIMYSRWISHSNVARLNTVCDARRLLKFPMLRTAEIKQLLAEVVQEVPLEPAKTEPPIHVVKETIPEERPPYTGSLKDFVKLHIDGAVDFSVRGAIAPEARRIFALSVGRFVTTIGAMEQAVRQEVRSRGLVTPNQVSPHKPKLQSGPPAYIKTTTKSDDDFAQLDKLIDDAIAAMKLVQEHMPRVREETERLRSVREKMKELLG